MHSIIGYAVDAFREGPWTRRYIVGVLGVDIEWAFLGRQSLAIFRLLATSTRESIKKGDEGQHPIFHRVRVVGGWPQEI